MSTPTLQTHLSHGRQAHVPHPHTAVPLHILQRTRVTPHPTALPAHYQARVRPPELLPLSTLVLTLVPKRITPHQAEVTSSHLPPTFFSSRQLREKTPMHLFPRSQHTVQCSNGILYSLKLTRRELPRRLPIRLHYKHIKMLQRRRVH